VRNKLIELYTVNIRLVEGGMDVFEITYNTKTLFSKNALGRFPTNQDLEELNIVADSDI
jgi:hypothetical protein